MQQRSDIQGLRAYAVLAVLLYHFGVYGFSGGFIGVDIFFVISGFLMTSIILRGLEQKRFSILKFYLARARRIIPALAVMCLALLLLGWFWLAPSDYAMLGKHSSSAISFTSNFVFMDEDGYFDEPSLSKWLLHTWSLSVEWQFYMLYPLLLAAVARYIAPNRGTLSRTISILGCTSLLASIILTPANQNLSFYLLPTRAWEMLAGGWVYLYAPSLNKRTSQLLELAGLSCLFFAMNQFHSLMAWPGAYALLPVIGTMLVITAARGNSWFTGTRIATALGDRSYSIYLWHWPVAVGLNYFALQSPFWIAAGIIASILLGALSYIAVEQPTRHLFTNRRGQLAIIVITTVIIIAGMGTGISYTKGIPSRVPASVQHIDKESTNRLPPFATPCGFNRKTLQLTPCIVGNPNHIRWVVWGDSHAGSIVSAVAAATESGVLYYTHSCAALFNTELKSKTTNNHCTEFTAQVAEQISRLPNNIGVIVINRYSVNIKGPNKAIHKPWGFIYTDRADLPYEEPTTTYTKRLTQTLCAVGKNRQLYAVAPIPELERDVPKTMAREAMIGNNVSDVTISLTEYKARNDIALAALHATAKKCGIRVLDPTPYLCSNGLCHGARDGMPLYFDDDHLSEFGNRLLLPLFRSLKQETPR